MVTHKTTKKILLALVLLTGWAEMVNAQSGWRMQPVVLQTRWAKEVCPNNALKEYPRPQMIRRQWQNLNGLWDYAITKKDAPQPNNFSGKILVPYPVESALSGVQKTLMPNQNIWYRRIINRPATKAKERVLLNFGAVDWQATVYVNGKEVGGHTGGYTAFSIDITNALKPGSNELAVKVFDPTDAGIGPHGKQVLNPANIYYTQSSGIWQTVWLETVPAISVKSLYMTPDIDKGLLALDIKTEGKNTDCIVEAIATAKGKRIAEWHSNHTGPNTNDLKANIKVNHPHLWSPDDPFLYDLIVRIRKGKTVIDEVKSYFGMRKIAIQKDAKGVDRIFLNNKYTYNLGTLDQGFWPEGLYTAPTDEALAFDIKAIKSMGFNTIRKHIKVEPARWYYHADKTGMLVWQDMVNPDQQLKEGSKSEFEKESSEILMQLHNYPSITTWVLFNEKWGQYDQERLTKWIKATDPSRIVNGHSGEYLYVNDQLRSPSPNAYIGADMTDVHSYPQPMMSEKQQGKAQVCGEFGGIGVSVPGHQWNDLQGWGYVQATPKELANKYAVMVKRLKALEAQGLSGSIYTEPFDVEGEENGMLTYDREIIKIPLGRLREIHSELVNQTKGFALDPKFIIAKNIDADDSDEKYGELLKAFESGKRDSAFLRRLTLMAVRKKDQPNETLAGNAYIAQLKQVYNKENLLFISQITRTSKDSGFELFIKNPEKVNKILGKNSSENKVVGIIGKEELGPYMTENASPDWGKIEKKIVALYGKIGEEKYNGARMIWALEKQDWVDFGKYYALYYQTATERSEYHINNVSWSVFEHVTDPQVLEVAIRTVKYNVDNFSNGDPGDLDTYANLLYKAGRQKEAIELEMKAAKGAPENKEIQLNLEKMQKGSPTW